MEHLHKSGKLDNDDREHLTKYFYDHSDKYRVVRIPPAFEWIWHGCPFTVDTHEDYTYCKNLAESFDDIHFSVSDLIQRAKHEA